jgi:drug/metabolite transporter (DMT)-like permease
MTIAVTLLVLLAALMHATWNALIKGSRNTSVSTALMVTLGSALSAPLLLLVPMPAAQSWPHLIASWLVHQAYFALVAATYRQGDISLTYPLMRGVAPLLVACLASFLLPDETSAWTWLGIFTVSLGVFWIGGAGRGLRHAHRRSAALALANAVLIAAYSVIDGMGARAAGNAASYGLWLFFLMPLPYAFVMLAPHRHTLATHLRASAPLALLGAVLSVGAYLIVLWAMTLAPVAAVAALRETSVIFAALIGTLVFREALGPARVAGACLVAAGVALLQR